MPTLSRRRQNVGVEGRMPRPSRVRRHYWIERDESAVLAGHRLFGGLLQVEIDVITMFWPGWSGIS